MILLDTHVLLWQVSASPRLGVRACGQLQAAWEERAVAVSSYSFWEIGLLHAKGRLSLDLVPHALYRCLLADGLRVVPVNVAIALRAAELESEAFHRDPADRIITASALIGGYQLATADRRITDWVRKTRLLATLDPTT